MQALFSALGRRSLIIAAAILVVTAPALAHHGWSWTVEELSELKGVIRDVYLGNPHATLDVDVEGEIWKVELAPPRATERAGFTEASARAGDKVTAIGNRSRDQAERRMKAVRIIVNGKTYDVYPDRAPTK